MVSIWTWSALILAVYGALLLAAGLLRLAGNEAPPATLKMTHLRADVWWPAIMLAVSAALFWAGRSGERGG